MNTNNFSQDELAIMERIAKHGELQAMDKVEITGLTSSKGQQLNGRIGTVRAISGTNDGEPNPYTARKADGRYKIDVEFDESKGKEFRPGQYTMMPEIQTYSLKRENLIMADISPGTFARDPEGMALLRRRGINNIASTADNEAATPEIAGFFPAIRWGDAKRVREVMEYYKNEGCPDPANQILDASGDTALIGGINHGHPEIVRLLLEYGGDCNRKCSIPMLRDIGITYFNMAFLSFDQVGGKTEEVINVLIDGGGDVNAMSSRGTPLSSAVRINSDHDARMRIIRKLLDHGANPNQIIHVHGPRNQGSSLFAACTDELGEYSQENRLEVVQLLVDSGADPGLMLILDSKGESCNAIHCAVSHRRPEVLRCLLSCAKGRAAVDAKRSQECAYPRENNGHGETAITMAVQDNGLEKGRANRDMAVQLLKAGADTNIEDHIGLSAAAWMRDDTGKKNELATLVKKAHDSRCSNSNFWNESEEVKSFIEDGENDIVQCDNCGCWADDNYENGERVQAFQRCSKCKKVFYCSRECQKKRWKTHKAVCKV